MKKSVTTNSEFVFREGRDGQLQFVGDFDGLYQNQKDPWGQSGNSNVEYEEYYKFSRTRLVSAIERIENRKSILEIGCGLGYATEFLAKNLAGSALSGMDISAVAIMRAREKFPEYSFEVGDIASSNFIAQEKYDVVIVNQILWYILESLEIAISNVHKLARPGGHSIISQAFLKEEQRYGADIVNGFDGLLEFMKSHHEERFSLIDSQFDRSGTLLHNDGLVVYKHIDA